MKQSNFAACGLIGNYRAPDLRGAPFTDGPGLAGNNPLDHGAKKIGLEVNCWKVTGCLRQTFKTSGTTGLVSQCNN